MTRTPSRAEARPTEKGQVSQFMRKLDEGMMRFFCGLVDRIRSIQERVRYRDEVDKADELWVQVMIQ